MNKLYALTELGEIWCLSLVQVISSPASIMIALAHSSEKVLTKDPPNSSGGSRTPSIIA